MISVGLVNVCSGELRASFNATVTTSLRIGQHMFIFLIHFHIHNNYFDSESSLEGGENFDTVSPIISFFVVLKQMNLLTYFIRLSSTIKPH